VALTVENIYIKYHKNSYMREGDMLQKKSRYIINFSDLDLALIDLKYK
jgi:hypothetical protein